jgi:hypothetical protein
MEQEMKLVFLPTLTDIRDMLGKNLYVDLIWMSRERDHTGLVKERFAKWSSKISARNVGSAPEPIFKRPEALDLDPLGAPDSRQLEAPPDAQAQSVQELTNLLGAARAAEFSEEYPVRAAAKSRRR